MATKTWAATNILTAADVNTYLMQRDAWPTYSPTLTSITEGNGTKTSYYTQIGRIVHFYVKFVLGSTSSVTGLIGISLPVAASRLDAGPIRARAYDASAGTGPLGITESWATTSRVDLYSASTAAATSSTVPFTWTTNDIVLMAGTYEAATAP